VAWNDTHNAAVNRYFGLQAPNPIASGGGKSEFFGRPEYQDGVTSVVGAQRGVPDVAMSGACGGAEEAYSSFAGYPAGWSLVCGTSEATPEFAAIVALADRWPGTGSGCSIRGCTRSRRGTPPASWM
jgi:subtilase family serine protease